MDFVWVIILLMVLAALPDLLRKKRRYPTRRTSKPGPMGGTTDTPNTQHSTETGKHGPVTTRETSSSAGKTTAPAPQPTTQKPTTQKPMNDPQPQIQEPNLPEPQAPVYTVVSKPDPALVMSTVGMASAVPWSRLAPQAQQIYAGIVWSELLQPPVSRRRSRR